MYCRQGGCRAAGSPADVQADVWVGFEETTTLTYGSVRSLDVVPATRQPRLRAQEPFCAATSNAEVQHNAALQRVPQVPGRNPFM